MSSDIATSIPREDERQGVARRPRLEAGRDPEVRPSLIGEAVVAITVLLAAAILTNVAPPPVADAPVASTRSAR